MAVHDRVRVLTQCGITVGPRGVRRVEANWLTRHVCREQTSTRGEVRKEPSENPPFQRYGGKPAVRNDRGGRGNVGIIRSPVRASILPDRAILDYRIIPRSKFLTMSS